MLDFHIYLTCIIIVMYIVSCFKQDDLLFYYTSVTFPPAKSSYNTCGFSCNKLNCFKHNLTSDEQFFQYAGIYDKNLLPNNITNLNNYTSFRTRIYKFCCTNL